MKLVPLGDRVVLKQFEAEETTKSGIILTTKSQEKPQEAEVIAVGPGGLVDGKEVTMQVKVGDKVIYSKYAGNEVKLGDEELNTVEMTYKEAKKYIEDAQKEAEKEAENGADSGESAEDEADAGDEAADAAEDGE